MALLAAVLPVHAVPKNLAADFGKEAQAVADHAAAVRGGWMKVLVKLGKANPGNQATGVRFTLPQAIMRKDLAVEGIYFKGRWLTLDAWIPAWKSVVQRVEDRGKQPLVLKGTAKSAAVTGEIVVRLPPDLAIDPDKNENIVFALSLATEGTVLKGTYRITSGLPKKKGAASGRAYVVDSNARVMEDYPKPAVQGKDGFALYSSATGLEREMCRRYAQVLWFDAIIQGLGSARPDYLAPRRPAFDPKAKKIEGPKKGDGRKSPVVPDLDDVDSDDLDLGDEPVAATRKRAAKGKGASGSPDWVSHPDAASRLAVLKDISLHLAGMRRTVEGYLASGTGGNMFNSFAKVSDPLFGPWFGFKPLPGKKDRPNILAADAGGAGQQEWHYLDNWQVMGPFPLGPPATQSSALPGLFRLNAAYPAYGQFMPRPRKEDEKKRAVGPERDPAILQWEPWPVDVCTGVLRPPNYSGPGQSIDGKCAAGFGNTAWIASTEVNSAADKELWMAAGVDDDAQLWINDKLVAAWPDPYKRTDMESPIMFRFKFRRGKNTILARIRHLPRVHPCDEKGNSTTAFWMRICTRGAPASAAAAAARDKAVADRTKNLRPFGPEVKGWRGNWIGVQPDEKPLTAWDWKTGINVRWRTGLPMTVSTPVVTGNRVFTTASEHALVCLDKMTGKVLWWREFNVLELLKPDIAKRAHEAYGKYIELWQAAYPMALYPYTLNDTPPKVKHNGAEMTFDEARKKLGDLKRQYDQLIRGPIEKAGHPWKFCWQGGYLNHAGSTPVTDGKHIWVWSALGSAACFDMEGNRKWLVELPHHGPGYEVYSSPLLIDGPSTDSTGSQQAGSGEAKLILDIGSKDKRPPGMEASTGMLLALDAATGREVWRAPMLDPSTSSSPIAMRLTNGREDMTVIISGGSGVSTKAPSGFQWEAIQGGTVVRADDGKVLIPNLSVTTGYGTPVMVDDVVYHCGIMMHAATKLIMIDRDTLGAKRLWTRRQTQGMEPCVSPYDGYLYANLAIPTVGGQGDGGYAVFSAETGAQVNRRVNKGWGLYTTGGGRSYVPTAVVGGFVYCGDSGEAFGGKWLPRANVTVLEAKPHGRIIAQNGLPPRSNAGMAFDGDRIYYRNRFGMTCLGYTGEEGEAYEAEINADLIMKDLLLVKPGTGKAMAIAPEKGLHPAFDRRDLWTRPGPAFYFIGPVEGDSPQPVLSALTGHKRKQVSVSEGWKKTFALTLGGKEIPCWYEYYHPHTWARITLRDGRAGVIHPRSYGGFSKLKDANQAVYVYMIMRSGRPQTVRFVLNTKHSGVKAWLGGVLLEHQGRYKLAEGDYTFLGELRGGGDVDADDYCLDCYFLPAADDGKADLAAYYDELRSAKRYLDRVVKLKPDSPTAKKARQFLSALP